ncbi:tetratricopeptide repeat protein [Soonwooa sp.]|uniref:tetratricopeptide repeat protein n=1 Tax=Soonwooa sp. TaxID=1938592 RepID=UPI0026032DE4|nr:tetratricopeptide repeat protein [Soonwooa sp.]
MKVNSMNIKNLVLGVLVLGATSFGYAQTSVKKTAELQVARQQSNPAIETLKKQVEANPQDNNALVNLAVAYQDAKDWNNALETWKKVSTVLPDWAPSFYSQGYVYQSLKDVPNATTAYQKYIDLVKPEDVESSKKNLAYAHFFVAYSQFENNKDEAKKNIAKSLEYDPTNADALKLKEALAK